MKPLWTPTLAWIAAALAAFLLAMGLPESSGFGLELLFSHGAGAPR